MYPNSRPCAARSTRSRAARAWSLEQVLNTWLADQKPAGDDLRILAGEAMRGFARWTEDIAANNDGMWKAAHFRVSADALRTEHRLVALALPKAEQPALVEEPVIEIAEAAPAEEAAPVRPQPTVIEVQAVNPAFAATTTNLKLEPIVDVGEAQTMLDTVSFVSTSAEAAPPVAPPASFGATQVIRGEAPEAAELHSHELPADFEFESSPTLILRDSPASVPAPVEIEGIDFASLSAVSGLPPAPETAVALEPEASQPEAPQFESLQFETPLPEALQVEPPQPEMPDTQGLEISFSEAEGDIPIDLADFNFDSPAAAEPPKTVEPVADALEMAEPIDDQIKATAGVECRKDAAHRDSALQRVPQ